MSSITANFTNGQLMKVYPNAPHANLRDLSTSPFRNSLTQLLTRDVFQKVLDYLQVKEVIKLRLVSKQDYEGAQTHLLAKINRERISFKDLFPNYFLERKCWQSDVLGFFGKNAKDLSFVNLEGMRSDYENDFFAKIVEKCPNIKELQVREFITTRNLLRLSTLKDLNKLDLFKSCFINDLKESEDVAAAEKVQDVFFPAVTEFHFDPYLSDQNIINLLSKLKNLSILNLSKKTEKRDQSKEERIMIRKNEMESVSNFTGLTELNFQNRKIDKNTLDALKALCVNNKKITKLNLFLNSQEDTSVEVMKSIAGLETLSRLAISFYKNRYLGNINTEIIEIIRVIAKLPNLRELELTGDVIRGDLLNEISSVFKSLIRLKLEYTEFYHSDFKWIKDCTQLSILELNTCAIKKGDLDKFFNISSLSELVILNSDITEVNYHNLGELNRLKKLDIQVCVPTEDSLLLAIPKLNQLNDLSISYMKLEHQNEGKSWEEDFLPKSLTKLKLHDLPTFCTERIINEIVHLKYLTKLHLPYSNLYSNHVKKISKMLNLNDLDLTGNLIGNSGAEAICELKNLEYLQLSSCEIENAGLNMIFNLKKLQKLNLSYNKISNEVVREIFKIKKIRSIDLRGNESITEEYSSDFKKEFVDKTSFCLKPKLRLPEKPEEEMEL